MESNDITETFHPALPAKDHHRATLDQLEMLQRMVEFAYNRLKGLRSGMSSVRGIIQQEIHTLEGKIMKLFSRQMAVKLEAVHDRHVVDELFCNYPSTAQFFDVVELQPEIAEKLSNDCALEEYCLLSDEEVDEYLRYHFSQINTPYNADQAQRLKAAFRILRLYTNRLRRGEKASELQWQSWSETMPESSVLNSRDSLTSYVSVFNSQLDVTSTQQQQTPSSLSVPTTKSMSLSGSIPHSPKLKLKMSPLISRSKSDEANIGRRLNTDNLKSSGSFSGERPHLKGNGRRPGPLNLTIANSNGGEQQNGNLLNDNDSTRSRSSSISQSPRTPTRLSHYGMGHSIKHRFSTKTFLISLTCDYCQRIIFVGVRCKECGFKCHKKCSRKAPPSCGLPEQLERIFIQTLQQDSSSDAAFKFHTLPNMKRTNSEPSNILLGVDQDKTFGRSTNLSHGNLTAPVDDSRPLAFHNPYIGHHGRIRVSQSGDSCSTTSSASSVPSSPATFLDVGGPPSSAPPESMIYFTASGDHVPHEQFSFCDDDDDEDDDDDDNDDDMSSTADTLTGTIQSEMSVQSIHSKLSEGAKSMDSTLSGSNEDCSVDNLDSQISDVIPQHIQLRDSEMSRSDKFEMMMSLHEKGSLMSEWVIPFSDLILDELIGKGRLGEVYRARWHGEVAVKIMHVENVTEQDKYSFKCKVQTLRKTRHENLVLFMAACMDSPTLAIVTSLCKGLTLYQHVHLRMNKFDSNKIIAIIVQISQLSECPKLPMQEGGLYQQAMSYLHARGIVHKDLKTKNVFVENNRIVITDFGLLSVADVIDSHCRDCLDRLPIPRGWLCYQAPEIVRVLNPQTPGREVGFYTKESDVYAFGTVWYELLAGVWPFDKQCPESVIWKIGKGMKQPISSLEESRDVKDILSLCWAYSPENRPSFKILLQAFERLPRKKAITRSPSQPLYMTRAADALILS